MANDKVIRLTKYLEDQQARLKDGIPEKHKVNPEAFVRFVKREIFLTSKKIEELTK